MRPETYPSPEPGPQERPVMVLKDPLLLMLTSEPGPIERRLVRWPWRPSDVHACEHPPRALITVRGLSQGDFVQCLTCGWERPA